MSKFIQTVQYLEAPAVFELKSKEIIIPEHEDLTPDITKRKKHTRGKSTDYQGKAYMESVYQKLIEKEREVIVAENAQKIRSSYTNLKQKWSRSCEHYDPFSPSDNAKINNFFKSGRKRLDLRVIHEQMPQRLQLLKKHNSKISINYSSVHELSKISKEKKKYNQWIDKSSNHITKSPIYKKVKKLLKQMVKIITLKENIAEHENSLKCERKQPSIRVRQRYGKRKKNSGIIFDYRNLKKDISPKKKE